VCVERIGPKREGAPLAPTANFDTDEALDGVDDARVLAAVARAVPRAHWQRFYDTRAWFRRALDNTELRAQLLGRPDSIMDALTLAVRQRQPRVVEWLLDDERVTSLVLTRLTEITGLAIHQSPAPDAALDAIQRLLLARLAPLDAAPSFPRLIRAVRARDIKDVRAVLAVGIDAGGGDNHALRLAVEKADAQESEGRRLPIVDALLATGRVDGMREGVRGETAPIVRAVEQGDVAIADRLFDYNDTLPAEGRAGLMSDKKRDRPRYLDPSSMARELYTAADESGSRAMSVLVEHRVPLRDPHALALLDPPSVVYRSPPSRTPPPMPSFDLPLSDSDSE